MFEMGWVVLLIGVVALGALLLWLGGGRGNKPASYDKRPGGYDETR